MNGIVQNDKIRKMGKIWKTNIFDISSKEDVFYFKKSIVKMIMHRILK
jgi:hypothetical protein